jgi:uncharacterized ferritin-like protein (DUF455 family)
MKPGVFEESANCLGLADPIQKCDAVSALADEVSRAEIDWDSRYPVRPITAPGRPLHPLLVSPSRVPRRRLGTEEGRAALIHAIAHIEFNAINLALDAAYRFRDLPRHFTLDWISVAQDEARHFRLLNTRLEQLGRKYGDFPAHNGLWEMAEKTADSCMVRMALVPRVLEARGLDVTPGMIERLRGAGDAATIAILNVILEEEVRHVAIGSKWFNFCCEREGKPPVETFLGLLEQHFTGQLRGPFNLEARAEAGFTEEEIEALMAGIG